MRLIDVALPVPLPHAFTYDATTLARADVGARVLCPFGPRKLVGVVLAARDGEPPEGVRAALAVLDDAPALPADLVTFLRDLGSYYLAPIGEVMRLALPPVEKELARAQGKSGGVSTRAVQWAVATDAVEEPGKLRGAAASVLARLRAEGALPVARLGARRDAVKRLEALGLARLELREAPRDPFFAEAMPKDVPPELTEAQAIAGRALGDALAGTQPRTFLLHGVTGSGKTEVYLRAIAAARASGRGVLVLVPEIALTPQLVGRFRARFGDEVAVLHSALTPRERLGMWQRIHRAEVDVVIGARSALFAPLAGVGLIVVDEEHDSSFKQEEGVRYHARDMAILRAHRAGAVCLLGSATPSLEAEHLARTGKATRLSLPERASAKAELPRVEIVDLRRIGPGPTGDRRLSSFLHRAIEQTLAAREQTILFLNRRGFAPSVRCEACGKAASCRDCSVALTYHKRSGLLRCHYCDFATAMPRDCPACHAPALALEGLGTEKLEETLGLAFPAARVARLDRDVASGKAVERVLERVRAREVDILVGTQMVTKGHDLPHVTLVGVVNADAATSIPDFRAAERAFQLIVQVAGRAGRADLPGRVLVQTYDPDHPAVRFGAKHDVTGFLEHELGNRRELGYPPFSRMGLVRVDAPREDEARAAAQVLGEAARAAFARGVEVLGPAPAPLARLRDRFRFRVMVRGSDRAALRQALLAVDRAREGLPRAVRAIIDVDPVQLL